MGHFSIQPKLHHTSAPSQEIGEFKRDSADRLTANVMRGLQAKEQEQAEGLTPRLISTSLDTSCSGSTLGASGDACEQEADRVETRHGASLQVMSMSAPADSSASVQRQLDTNHPHHPHQIWQRAQSITPVVHRQIDPRVQMRQMVQRADQMAKNQASFDLESRLNASKGGGSPLSEDVRGCREPRFGADFSGVRVHTGSEAVQMNQELGTQFTNEKEINPQVEPSNNKVGGTEKECADILRRIRNLIQEVRKRIGELAENVHNLPETHPDDDKKPRLSKRGHRRLINEAKESLAAQKAKYVAKCGQLPEDVRESDDPNVNWFRLPDWAVRAGVIIVAGAIVIGATVTLPSWGLAALITLAGLLGLQLIDRRPIH